DRRLRVRPRSGEDVTHLLPLAGHEELTQRLHARPDVDSGAHVVARRARPQGRDEVVDAVVELVAHADATSEVRDGAAETAVASRGRPCPSEAPTARPARSHTSQMSRRS